MVESSRQDSSGLVGAQRLSPGIVLGPVPSHHQFTAAFSTTAHFPNPHLNLTPGDISAVFICIFGFLGRIPPKKSRCKSTRKCFRRKTSVCYLGKLEQFEKHETKQIIYNLYRVFVSIFTQTLTKKNSLGFLFVISGTSENKQKNNVNLKSEYQLCCFERNISYNFTSLKKRLTND